MNIAIPVADAITVVAQLVNGMIARPAQQAPDQTRTLADRLDAVAAQAEAAGLTYAVRIEAKARMLRTRADADPYRPLYVSELKILAEDLLRIAGEVARAERMQAAMAIRFPTEPQVPQALPDGVSDFAAYHARREEKRRQDAKGRVSRLLDRLGWWPRQDGDGGDAA